MIVVYKLSKDAQFILVKSTFKAINIADIFMKEMFCLHDIPIVVISHRDAKFIGNF